MDYEDCRHLTVVDLHETGPWIHMFVLEQSGEMGTVRKVCLLTTLTKESLQVPVYPYSPLSHGERHTVQQILHPYKIIIDTERQTHQK